MTPEQQAEWEAMLDEHPVTTYRPTVATMEDEIRHVRYVLDHGFVRLVDYMGDDAAIVQAARVSYGRGTKKALNDYGLVRYLLRGGHTTPFEMCEIKLHVKMPIFVARQWIRHRTANVNEYSGRYSILAKEFYIPAPERIGVQSSTNKQGTGLSVTASQAAAVQRLLIREASNDYEAYEELLNDDGKGNPVDKSEPMIARELARLGLGLNYYTEWYWKIDLHNLLHFLRLRCDNHAQWEIRQYADIIHNMVKAWCPAAAGAFRDYRLNSVMFSGPEIEVLKEWIGHHYNATHAREEMAAELKDCGSSQREIREFMERLGIAKER
jgi:thymidylate synthase (FAD)